MFWSLTAGSSNAVRYTGTVTLAASPPVRREAGHTAVTVLRETGGVSPLPVEPDLDGFRALAPGRRVIPVMRRLLADAETPVGIYQKLAENKPGTFLLESAEHGGTFSRYSFIGAHSAAVLTERDGQAHWDGTPPVVLPRHGDPLQVLRESLALLHTERLPGLPPLTGGFVGYLGYDVVRRLESLPDDLPDELGLPEMALVLATDLAVLDHLDGTVLLVANAVNWDDSDERVDDAWADAVARLDAMTARLRAPTPSSVTGHDEHAEPRYRSRTERDDYLAAVETAKEQIRAGEIFQVVLSQRFELERDPGTPPVDPLSLYRVLRRTNPSPYMYLLRLDGFDIVGSSPEALVKVDQGRALTHPIAGTRPRGDTPTEDARLAVELLADEKERAEHLMLVDLGRNDLGRVCRPGTVEVVDFMTVRRYSHVMHLESSVVGRLLPARTALEALLACFPAGTLSGAPKVRAMEIIEQLEQARRGPYGGVVGYLDFAGDLDTAIAIRTAVLKDGRLWVQAGAGIVADSDPASEDAECRAKAMAVLRAAAVAASMTMPTDGA
jgi:anthranilate synthase component I